MRSSGILLHITSLPGPYGVGTMGPQARAFVDFLAQAGQRHWQVLPVGPTSYGDSPYQSFSTYAGSPYLISLEELEADGLLLAGEASSVDWGSDPLQVDYEKLYRGRTTVLRRAFERGGQRDRDQVAAFRREHKSWLEDYALFMALKTRFAMVCWQDWPDRALRLREPEALAQAGAELREDVDFWVYVQYLFYTQWQSLREYAGDQGVALVGDIPIYVALDSADAWSHPEILQLDGEGRPIRVAGCPPDAFTEDGQLWGNPLYNWEALAADGFGWWLDRVEILSRLYDVVRIDHFRGFESYYAIPAGAQNAKIGQWCPGPGLALFEAIRRRVGELRFIAEDLGFLTPQVRDMVTASGYPGMKVLQFAFDCWCQSDYLPFRYDHNCVVYTGTHDNNTILGWFASQNEADRQFCRDFLDLRDDREVCWKLIAAAWSSVADLAIAPMQDFLELGEEARMNEPSTLGGNWQWRMAQGVLTDGLAGRIRRLTCVYGRV